MNIKLKQERYVHYCATRVLEKKTFIRYAQNLNIRKTNNLIVFGSNEAKGPKQDGQNRLGSHVSVEGEP